jgi:predicted PurR-regulated permease PerM
MPTTRVSDDDSVDPLVRKAAAWSWRLLAIGAVIAGLLWVVARLQVILVPVALAMMVAALMLPAVDWLDRRGAPRGGAVALVILGGFGVFGGILTFVVSQFVSGLPGLVEQVTKSIDSLRAWLIEGPAHLSREQIDNAGNTAIKALRDNQEKLTTGALSTAATLTEIITGAFLVLFTLIFLLHGGRNIYGFVTRIVPASARERVDRKSVV